MILNIIDKRARQYRWQRVNAIIESTWHDNGCEDSDQAEHDKNEVAYDERENVSLAAAISWVHSLPGKVTLYIYDLGTGTAGLRRN